MTDWNPGAFPEVKCPRCPVCSSEPPFIYPTFAQAFCPNEDCDVLCWIPWDTLEQNLMDARPAIMTETPMEPPAE